MSVEDVIGVANPRVFDAHVNTISGGIRMHVFIVPIGQSVVQISRSFGTYVLQAGETLSTVTWNLPSAVGSPGAFYALWNKSTTTTVNIVTVDGDTCVFDTLGPSSGVGQDTFSPIWSDGINAWSA